MTLAAEGRLIDRLLKDPTSALAVEYGADGISRADHLLMVVVDELRLLRWALAAKKGAPKPKPISPLAKNNGGRRRGDTDGRTPEDVKAMLARYGPQPKEVVAA